MQPFDSIDRLENASVLDPIASVLRRVIRTVLQPQDLRDALQGVWLGHPFHPVAVQVPIGTWASAGVLDLLPGNEKASTTLVATGVTAALPSAASGWADWSELKPAQARVGLVHAVTNATAIGLYTSSLVARLRGDHRRGKLLGFAGLAAVGAGGLLGGHLAYRQGAGVNPAATPTTAPGMLRNIDLRESEYGLSR
jgi:uncharacterized membrane protein